VVRKLRSDPRATITCGQNLEPQGVLPRNVAVRELMIQEIGSDNLIVPRKVRCHIVLWKSPHPRKRGNVPSVPGFPPGFPKCIFFGCRIGPFGSFILDTGSRYSTKKERFFG